LKSGQLQAGGLVGALGAIQTWLGTTDGMGFLEKAAVILNLQPATLNGIAMMGTGLLLVLLRAHTEWSLQEKVDGVDKKVAVP